MSKMYTLHTVYGLVFEDECLNLESLSVISLHLVLKLRVLQKDLFAQSSNFGGFIWSRPWGSQSNKSFANILTVCANKYKVCHRKLERRSFITIHALDVVKDCIALLTSSTYTIRAIHLLKVNIWSFGRIQWNFMYVILTVKFRPN